MSNYFHRFHNWLKGKETKAGIQESGVRIEEKNITFF
jgi:hypothetical protein